MATRFFKKPSPADPVRLANGQNLKFNSADYRVGFFATDSQSLAQELVGYIERGQFGLTEVTWAEYDSEYLKKKRGRALPVPSREEISGSKYHPNPFLELHGAGAAAVAERSNMPVRVLDPEAVIQPAKSDVEQVPAPFKPNLGRR